MDNLSLYARSPQSPASKAITSLGDSLPPLPPAPRDSRLAVLTLSYRDCQIQTLPEGRPWRQQCLQTSLFTSSSSLLPQPRLCSGNIACQVGFPSGNSTKIAEERKREDSFGGSSPGRWPALTNPRTLKAVSPGHVGRVQDGRHIPPGARLRVLGDHLRQDLCVLFSMAETLSGGRGQSRSLHLFGKGQPLSRSLASP